MIHAKYSIPPLHIDDTQDPKDTSQSEDNKSRCKLASLFRLLDVKGWSLQIYDSVAFRCTQVPTQFYTNPFGLLFSEITASKILKLDFNMNIVQQGITDYGFNLPAFYLNAAIFQARSDINCIVHLFSPLLTGLASTKAGFLPVNVEGLPVQDVAYFDYKGDFDFSIGEQVAKTLGSRSQILVLRNHSVVVCGRTPEETFLNTGLLFMNAGTQLVAQAAVQSIDDLILLPLTEAHLDKDKLQQCLLKMNAKPKDNILWKIGELEFESEMRRLDSMGFKTGYPYKKKFHGLEKQEITSSSS